MLRRYLNYTMALVLGLFLLTGCGGGASPDEPAASSQTSETQPAESEEEMAETMEEGDDHDEHEGEGDDHDDHEGEGEHDDHDDHEGEGEHDDHDDHDHDAEAVAVDLPELTEVALDGRALRVVATTSIIGDVVANIGGDAIELTTLMGPGVDPHSFEPSASDFASIADADVIFVNGWGLEEGLVEDLETAAEGVPVVVISAGIEPLEFGEGGHDHHGEGEHEEGEHEEGEHEEGEHEEGEHEEGEHDDHDDHEGDEHGHDHSGADPHVWFSVHGVEQWATNVETVLHKLDPANDESYEANLASYLAQLEELESYIEEQVASIPMENRKLVTNHDSFGYLAAEYEFEVVGTIIPSASTLSEPSASDLAELIDEMREEGICTVFTENTVSDQLAATVAGELNDCESVQVLPLFTGALGPEGSSADNYIGFMRTNIDTIVSGLGG